MAKTDNMMQAMYEMFGVGKGAEKDALTARDGENKNAAKPSTVVAQAAPKKPAEKSAEPPAAAVQPAPKKAPEPPAVSVLAEGTTFEGSLNAKGDVEIAGEFKGNIVSEGAVRLRSSIQSGISAKSVELTNCVLTGDVTVSGIVAVGENSRIIGNVSAMELLCAGEIAGDLKITDSVRLDARARVSGSIVTGAISVEKGASISGNVQIRTPSETKT